MEHCDATGAHRGILSGGSNPASTTRQPAGYSRPMLRLILLLSLIPSLLLAAEPSDYAGRWTFDEGSGDRAGVEKVIETTAEGFPRLFRGLVKKKLAPAARIVDYFHFEPGDGRISISTNVSEGWATDLAGTPVEKLADNGDTVTIRRWMEDGLLHTLGEGKGGSTSYVFTLESPKTLRVDVTVASDKLPEPMRFPLHYTR
jgi:hypothetical protein